MEHRIYLSTAVLLAVKGRKKKNNLSKPLVSGIRIDKAPLSKHLVTEKGDIIAMLTEETVFSLQ